MFNMLMPSTQGRPAERFHRPGGEVGKPPDAVADDAATTGMPEADERPIAQPTSDEVSLPASQRISKIACARKCRCHAAEQARELLESSAAWRDVVAAGRKLTPEF